MNILTEQRDFSYGKIPFYLTPRQIFQNQILFLSKKHAQYLQ